MNLTRNFTRYFNYFLDEFIPPYIRDRLWFVYIPFRSLFRGKSVFFQEFKKKVFLLDSQEFAEIYAQTAAVHVERDTDLNRKCVQKILSEIVGPNVLEVGCGRGYLAGLLGINNQVTACDFRMDLSLPSRYPNVQFIEADIERLPFADKSFDSVICTHTLEHVQDFSASLTEIHRVCRQRLIIVVPRQRPYLYTFDLHVRFFPYRFTFLDYFLPYMVGASYHLELLDGDWYYREDCV